MKPSDAELLQDLIANPCHDKYSKKGRAIVDLAKAELARRAQPASVPAELVEQWEKEWAVICGASLGKQNFMIRKAAAYGREQAQTQEPPTC